MKTWMMKSCIVLILAVSITLVLSGCLALYSCKLKSFEVSKDGNTITVNYQFKNFGRTAINGYTICTLIKCKNKETDANCVFNNRQSIERTVEPGSDVISNYFIEFIGEDRGRYTVTGVEITETSLTIYK